MEQFDRKSVPSIETTSIEASIKARDRAMANPEFVAMLKARITEINERAPAPTLTREQFLEMTEQDGTSPG